VTQYGGIKVALEAVEIGPYMLQPVGLRRKVSYGDYVFRIGYGDYFFRIDPGMFLLPLNITDGASLAYQSSEECTLMNCFPDGSSSWYPAGPPLWSTSIRLPPFFNHFCSHIGELRE
jgi:hypothetical protein